MKDWPNMTGESSMAQSSLASEFAETENSASKLRVGSSEKDDMGRALNLEFTFFIFVSNQQLSSVRFLTIIFLLMDVDGQERPKLRPNWTETEVDRDRDLDRMVCQKPDRDRDHPTLVIHESHADKVLNIHGTR